MAEPMNVPLGLISDVKICLLAEDIEASTGLALDIGSTVGKLIYRSNKEYKDGKPIQAQDDVTKGTAHFAMFPRTDVTGMIKYLKENADLTPNEKGSLIVNSSGVGGAAFRKELEHGLNCKLDILSEFDCFCKALLAMEKSFTEEELFIPDSPDIKTHEEEMRIKLEPLMEKIYDMTELKEASDELSATMKDEDRPRMLVMAGSGTGIMQINSDDTFSILDGVYTAGRFMYGLAALLTGENDFNTLMELAKKGEGRTTDIWSSDLLGGTTENSGESLYEMGMDDIDMHMFPFGKGISTRKEDMKKEDLVWSTFMATAVIHCQMVNACVKACKAKHVYFAGNVFNTEMMRTAISLKKFDMTFFNSKDTQYEYHFLRNGGMFGALGAFINKKKAG